ncbi:hypothetical protein ACFV0T_24720 [Streptomyces sp. NPDC059582]|uniref:hypothetical protein n=1 Tax=Streptomyces sp. NPDC059582 TaxID=3346875 RepID=UPI00368B1F77
MVWIIGASLFPSKEFHWRSCAMAQLRYGPHRLMTRRELVCRIGRFTTGGCPRSLDRRSDYP